MIEGGASREMEIQDGSLAARDSMSLGRPDSWIASSGGLELSLSVISSEGESDRNRDLAGVVAAEELGLALEATWKRPSFGDALRFAIEQGLGATLGNVQHEKGLIFSGGPSEQTSEPEGGEADRGRARPALTKSQCEALCEALQLGYRWVPWRPLVPWWDVEYQPEAPGQLVLLAPLAKTSSGSSPARSLPSSVLAETLSRNKCIIVQSRGQRARVRGTLAARSAASTARSETDLTLGGAFRDWLGNTDKTTDDANGFYDRSLGAVTNDGAANKPYQLKSATLSGARGGTVRAKYDDSGHMVRMDLARSGPCLPVGATCSQRFAYEWDEVGRLGRARRWDTAPGSSIDDPLPGGAPAADLRYTYDAGDQRVIKHAVDTSGESFTLYVFASLELRRSQFGTAYSDGGSGPADYEASVFTVVPYLLANGVRLARLAYEGTSEVPEVTPGTGAGQVNASVSQVHVFFELGDHLGSTSVVLDKATSELVERSTFQGYGATESDYRPGRWNAFREDYRFTGKEEDAEVGLTYFGKRYLNAYLGRWISADPLAIHAPGEADLNVYAYVSGSFLKNVDPLGLEEQTVDAANAGGASAADPAEHMGTGREGASSDGSYLEANSSAEYVDTTQAIVGSATSAGGVAVMAARVSVALALTWAAGNALKVTGDTKCSGADCDGRAGSAMVGSGVTAAVEFKAGLQAAARTSAKPAPEPKVDVQKVSKELDEIEEKVLGALEPQRARSAPSLPAPREVNPWFHGSSLHSFTVGEEGLTMFRIHGPGQATGQWGAPMRYATQAEARAALALRAEWNQATHISEIRLAPGTQVQVGRAGGQGEFAGGGFQLRVLNDHDVARQVVVKTEALPK